MAKILLANNVTSVSLGNIELADDTNNYFDAEPVLFSEGLNYTLNEDNTYTVTGIGTCEDIIINIPVMYNNKKVTKIANNAFKDLTSITTVNMSDYIIVIGEYAFSGCTNLINVRLSNKLTDLGRYAFKDCTHIITIKIPDSTQEIGSGCFSGCSNLVSMTLPFAGSTRKTDTNYPYPFGYIFGGTSYSGSIKCEQRYYSSPTGASTRYYYIPVTLISITITNCQRLQSGAFSGCKNIVNIILSGVVTDIDKYAFYYCEALTNFTINNNVVSIGEGAFQGCKALTNIVIPDNVNNIGEKAFAACNSLVNITVSNNNNVFDSRNNCNAIIKKDTTTLISGCSATIIPNNITTIGKSAFYQCTNLATIILPNNITKIEDTAFYECDNLESITIPASVTTMGINVFYGCSLLVNAGPLDGNYNIKFG